MGFYVYVCICVWVYMCMGVYVYGCAYLTYTHIVCLPSRHTFRNLRRYTFRQVSGVYIYVGKRISLCRHTDYLTQTTCLRVPTQNIVTNWSMQAHGRSHRNHACVSPCTCIDGLTEIYVVIRLCRYTNQSMQAYRRSHACVSPCTCIDYRTKLDVGIPLRRLRGYMCMSVHERVYAGIETSHRTTWVYLYVGHVGIRLCRYTNWSMQAYGKYQRNRMRVPAQSIVYELVYAGTQTISQKPHMCVSVYLHRLSVSVRSSVCLRRQVRIQYSMQVKFVYKTISQKPRQSMQVHGDAHRTKTYVGIPVRRLRGYTSMQERELVYAGIRTVSQRPHICLRILTQTISQKPMQVRELVYAGI